LEGFSKNINVHTQEKELTPSKILKQPIGRLRKKLKTTFLAKKKKKVRRWWQL